MPFFFGHSDLSRCNALVDTYIFKSDDTRFDKTSTLHTDWKFIEIRVLSVELSLCLLAMLGIWAQYLDGNEHLFRHFLCFDFGMLEFLFFFLCFFSS